jgi:hypothetical protein
VFRVSLVVLRAASTHGLCRQEADTLELGNVSRLVEETIELLKLAASKHAALRLLLGTNVPPVRANPAMLRQILINLASAEKKLEIKTQKELDLDAKVLRSSSLKHAVCAEQSLVNYRVAPFAWVPEQSERSIE